MIVLPRPEQQEEEDDDDDENRPRDQEEQKIVEKTEIERGLELGSNEKHCDNEYLGTNVHQISSQVFLERGLKEGKSAITSRFWTSRQLHTKTEAALTGPRPITHYIALLWYKGGDGSLLSRFGYWLLAIQSRYCSWALLAVCCHLISTSAPKTLRS